MGPYGAAGGVVALQRDAFNSLPARYENRVYRCLLRRVREPPEAEDFFRETWMRIVENIRRVDPWRRFEA